MPGYYIGLISGTSMDGVDAALVRFGDRSVDIVSAATSAYPDALREELLGAAQAPDTCTADVIGALDHWVGECFRDAALGSTVEMKIPRVVGGPGNPRREDRVKVRTVRRFRHDPFYLRGLFIESQNEALRTGDAAIHLQHHI